MSNLDFDLVIVGAGPAGMSAAVAGSKMGLSVAVYDDQATPGGQIYRGIECADAESRASQIGSDYLRGIDLVRAFRACSASYFPLHQVWQIDRDGTVYVSCGHSSRVVRGKRILIATGATERPVPIRGWLLPGVMTVGSAQIMHKSANALPGKQVWIAGCGPLAVYYAAEVARSGSKVAGFLDTSSAPTLSGAFRHVRSALGGAGYLAKGLGYLRNIKRAGFPHIKGVEDVEIIGNEKVEKIRWRCNGEWQEAGADGVLLHEGVVPHTHLALSVGCSHVWDESQACFRPVSGELGNTSEATIFVAGDCTSIDGVKSARIKGELAAIAIAYDLHYISAESRDARSAPLRLSLRRDRRIRPFLEWAFRPRSSVLLPRNDSVVCRCESVTAKQIRTAVDAGCAHADSVKAKLRCGMGPCQGRICSNIVTSLVADCTKLDHAAVGPYRIRPPLRSISLIDLASLTVDTTG